LEKALRTAIDGVGIRPPGLAPLGAESAEKGFVAVFHSTEKCRKTRHLLMRTPTNKTPHSVFSWRETQPRNHALKGVRLLWRVGYFEEDIDMAKIKDKQAKEGGLSDELSERALQRIDEMIEQLSERHAAALRKIAKQEKDLDENLEQVSAAAEAALENLAEHEKNVNEKLEQLSERHAATLALLARLENETDEKLEQVSAEAEAALEIQAEKA
jgi:NADH dehydrogenase/NADH:ubiquinone oxidoreductase subunit G